MLLLLLALTGQVSLEARVQADAPYPVTLTYERTDVSPLEAIPFTVLEARGSRISNLEANGRPVSLERADAPQLRGELPAPDRGAPIVLRYDVVGTTVPIVVLEHDEASFTASVTVPEGAHVVESFPSGLAARDAMHTLELPVVPAFVSLTLADDAPFLTIPQALDLGSVVLLAGLGIVAIRRRR